MKPKEEIILSKNQLNSLNKLNQDKDFNSLEEESRRLLLKFPNNTHLNNFLGASLAGKGLLTEAIIAFNNALIEAENKSKILNNLGVTYLKMEAFEKALDYFNESIKEDKRLFHCPQKKPLIASKEEIFLNPPSRSAKLRYVIRNSNKFIFPKDLINKFQSYLDIESIGLKL